MVEYMKSPADAPTLEGICRKLGVAPAGLLRKREPAAAALEGASDEQVLAAMAAEPGLMERPVVVKGDRAVIGRPPENVLALF